MLADRPEFPESLKSRDISAVATTSSLPFVRMPLQAEDRQSLVFITFDIPLFFIPLRSYQILTKFFHILVVAVNYCLGIPEAIIEP